MAESVWTKIEPPKEVNLKEIISEEIQASKKKNEKHPRVSSTEQFSDEEIVKHVLQLLSSKEKKFDENDLEDLQNVDVDSDLEDSEDEVIEKHSDKFELIKQEFAPVPGLNVNQKVERSISPELHEETKARKSASKKAKQKKVKTEKNYNKIDEFEKFVIEFKTLVEEKLIGENILLKVNEILATGTESIIVHANGNTKYTRREIPEECILKVYKTGYSCDTDYIRFLKDDYRYKNRIRNLTIKKSILLWAEKERNNLLILQKLEIPCPEFIALRQNVLVMSFLGKDHIPAKKLCEAELTDEQWEFAYNQIINVITTLYKKGNLILGQLDENNILWYNNQCYFIDLGYAVDPCHLFGFSQLCHSFRELSKFFKRKKVANVKSEGELFKNLVGCERIDCKLDAVKQKLREYYATLDSSDIELIPKF